jgi:hypothetical protein
LFINVLESLRLGLAGAARRGVCGHVDILADPPESFWTVFAEQLGCELYGMFVARK